LRYDEVDYSIFSVFSWDPNDKSGSAGTQDERYIKSDASIAYNVRFENLESATADAQEVVITDLLDVSLVDAATFVLGPIAFGSRSIVPPSNLRHYTADIDLRPESALIVRINAGIDLSTGLASWRFSSLDPTTMLPTESVFSGFLPPNVNSPEGEGSVLYTVTPKPALPTGTTIRNDAIIVFDTNPPIITPEWINTIDNSKPESSVQALAAIQTSPSFTINWSASDNGAGVQDYSIFVSNNGGPFSALVENTTAMALVFAGEPGHGYAFYSVARDLVGHVEDAPAVPDTTTTIALPAVDVTPQTRITRGGSRLNRTTQRYVQTLTVRNASAQPITGPVSIVFDQLSFNASLFATTGATAIVAPLGSPYVILNVGSDGILSPGETVTYNLEFTNATNGPVTYNTRVLAGPGSR
jgi:hypothetical protein